MNPAKAKEIWNELQQYSWANDGQIIWGTSPWVDGLSKRVRGAYPGAYYFFSGCTLRDWWLE